MMSQQEFISNKIKQGFSKQQATMMAKMSFARQGYAQQGIIRRNLNDAQAKELNTLTGIEFTPEFAKSGYFVTEQELDAQQKIKKDEDLKLKARRRYKITDITAERESPFANRQIWHDRKPEYYMGREEVKEGKQYTTIPYSKWAEYKTSPEYMKFAGLNQQPIVAQRQFGGYAQQAVFPKQKNWWELPNVNENIQNQMVSPQQDFSQMQYNTNAFTPAQPPQETLTRVPITSILEQNNTQTAQIQSNFKLPEIKQTLPTDVQVRNERQEVNKDVKDNTRTNVINPYAGVGLEESLGYMAEGFGEKNGYKIGVGGALSLLKGARTLGVGYATGKENRRVANEYDRERYRSEPRYENAQMGGKITNADIMAQDAITDQGQGNINMENGEFVKTPQGEIQPVVGARHIENGKIAEGVDANLEEGSKILSDAKGLIKLSAKDARELKDRYNISVKKGDTPASALRKFETKIGVKKEQEVLAGYAKQMEKSLVIKDEKTKQVNLEFLQRQIAKSNTKIDALQEMSEVVFEDLFEIQEGKPKKGTGNELYDSKGKEVTEYKEYTEVAQQGGEKNSLWKNIRANRGSGRKPTKEMLEQERKIKSKAQMGGYMDLAKQYGISNERAQELVAQMGGETEMPQQEEGGQDIIMQVAEALQQGANPEEIMQQLAQSMPPEEAQQIIEQAMQGEAPQPQEQGGGDIMQMVQQALESGADPNQVVEALVEQGVPPEEATQIVGQMTQGAQEEIPQEEQMMQSGGKVYAQQAPLFRKGNKFEDKKKFINQDEYGTGYFGDVVLNNSLDVNSENQRLHPEIFTKYQTKGQPNPKDTIGFQKAMKENYEKILKSALSLYGKDSQKYKDIEKQIGEDTFLNDDSVRGTEGKYGNYSATRPNFELEVLSDEDWNKVNKEGVNTASQLRTKFPDLYKKYVIDKKLDGDFWLGKIPTTKTEDVAKTPDTAPTAEKSKQKTEVRNNTKNVMPQLPVSLRMFPSAMVSIAKEQVPYGRLDPLKMTPEQMLAEQERMRQTDVDRVQQSGLSAGQQEAVMAQGLAASQMASNDAIYKTQEFNTQNQFQTNQFNNQQRTREAISNAHFNQDYQNKVLGSAAATERDIRNFYNESNRDNAQKYAYVENTRTPWTKKYTYILGRGYQYSDVEEEDLSIPNEYSMEQWKLMTRDEKEAAQNKVIKKNSQMGGMKRKYFGY